MSIPTSLPPTEAREDSVVRIAIANIEFSNPRPGNVAEKLANINPDILVILECASGNLSLPVFSDAGLRPVLLEPREGTSGVCIFKGPRVQADAALVPSPFPSRCAMPVGTLRVRANGVDFSVLAIHAPPPVSVCQDATGPTLSAVASWIDGGKMRTDIGVNRSGDPVVVAGDFNALPFSQGFREFASVGLTSSQDRTRIRRAGTWSPSAWIPSAARIDYILIPEEFEPIDSWVIGLPGSDHRAVVADILAKPSPERS